MKQFSQLILLNLYITLSLQQCITKKESVKLYPSEAEIYNWNFDEFFEGSGLTYSLNNTVQTTFKITDPVENTGGREQYQQTVQKIVSAKAQTYNEFWVNNFVFLYQEGLSFYLSVQTIDKDQNYQAPQFDTILKIDDITNDLNCFDFEFMPNNTYFVDCQNRVNEKVQNILYFITPTNQMKVLIEEAIMPAYKGRLLEKYTIQGQEQKSFTYLVKTTPSYSISTDGTLKEILQLKFIPQIYMDFQEIQIMLQMLQLCHIY